jgi:hypothetical protein
LADGAGAARRADLESGVKIPARVIVTSLTR